MHDIDNGIDNNADDGNAPFTDTPPTPRQVPMTWAEATRGRGLKCPECDCPHSRVIYKRDAAGDGNNRRRECCNCGCRFTTREDVIGG